MTAPADTGALLDDVRRNDDGSLDEVVGTGPYHLEQMDTGRWSLRLGRHLIGLYSTRAIKASIIENDLPAALPTQADARPAASEAVPVAWMMTCDGYRRPAEFYSERPTFVPPISKLVPLFANPQPAPATVGVEALRALIARGVVPPERDHAAVDPRDHRFVDGMNFAIKLMHENLAALLATASKEPE